MGSVRIGVGTEWLVDGRAYRVVRQTSPESLVAIDLRFQTEYGISTREVLELFEQGRLRFAIAEHGETPSKEFSQPDLRDVTPDIRDLVNQRWKLI